MSAPVATIAEIGKFDGQTVMIHGWLYNLRESGKLLFPIFRDGSGQIQGVVPKNAVAPEVFDALKGLTQESSVIVTGKVRADRRAPGGYELDVSDVKVACLEVETEAVWVSESVSIDFGNKIGLAHERIVRRNTVLAIGRTSTIHINASDFA